MMKDDLIQKAIKALNTMPDGSDIHNAADWLIEHGNTIRKALKALKALREQPAVDVEFEEAKELMRGAFEPDYDEEGIEHQQLWMQVIDELGIYPAAVNDTPRTEWQTGWNEAVCKATKLMCEKLKNAKPPDTGMRNVPYTDGSPSREWEDDTIAVRREDVPGDLAGAVKNIKEVSFDYIERAALLPFGTIRAVTRAAALLRESEE